ncbi:MAG: hypothetical protein QW255_05465 [Candidatus Bilamarchaeaceae archaeon]
MPRKKKEENQVEQISVQELIRLKNMLSILCKAPYVNYFVDNLMPYFVKILGQDEVDRHLVVNREKESTVPYSTMKKEIIYFAMKYFPDYSYKIIDSFYVNAPNFIIKEDLNEISGNVIVDDAYYKELEASMMPILSFIGNKLYINGTINIITAPPGGGKSLFIMMEALYQALYNNKRVIVFIIGDMDEYAVLKRMRNIIEHYKKKYQGLYFLDKLDNLKIVVENYGNINVYGIANRIKKEEFDFVFIDYDDNLVDIEGEGSLYVEAAKPYLVMDNYKHGKVIVFAAQGKPSSWRNDYDVSVGFLAASSKKEHIADSILVLKQPDKENKSYHELFILKDRHGINGAGHSIKALILKDSVFHVEDIS